MFLPGIKKNLKITQQCVFSMVELGPTGLTLSQRTTVNSGKI